MDLKSLEYVVCISYLSTAFIMIEVQSTVSEKIWERVLAHIGTQVISCLTVFFTLSVLNNEIVFEGIVKSAALFFLVVWSVLGVMGIHSSVGRLQKALSKTLHSDSESHSLGKISKQLLRGTLNVTGMIIATVLLLTLGKAITYISGLPFPYYGAVGLVFLSAAGAIIKEKKPQEKTRKAYQEV